MLSHFIYTGGMPQPDRTHRKAREVLTDIACRRDALIEERQHWLAKAWRFGDRNIRGLAEAADVSRNTIYADLQALGLDRSTPIDEEN